MASFSPTAAAFLGFRFVKERPSAVATWAGVSFVFNMLSAFAALVLGGQALRVFQASAGKLDDLTAIFELLLPATPALIAIAVITLAGMALVYASALRIFVGLESHVTFRVSEDERRVAMTVVAFTFIYFITTVVVLVGLGVMANISDAFSSWLGGFFAWVTPVALFAATTFVIVRLSLTPIIAVDRKRISLKESWVSTKGHFWPLAGSLALSLILFAVTAFMALMIVAALNHALSVGTGGAVPRDLLVRNSDDNPSVLTLMISEIIASICNGVLLPVVLGPLVRAYQAYDAQGFQHAYELFDTDRPIHLAGRIRDLRWTEGLAYIELDPAEAGAAARPFIVECADPAALSKLGLTLDSFRRGEDVSVIVSPLRTGEAGGLLREVTLRDGRTFYSRPILQPAPELAEP